MDGTPNIARIGVLVGDNTRASILSALMHGKALTASELAHEAGVTAQTASLHLAKLEAGGLLSRRKQGRHRYFTLASAEVAKLLESMMGFVAANSPLRTITGPRDAALRDTRVCYNHLAGHARARIFYRLWHRYQRLGVISNTTLPLVPRLERAPLPSSGQPGASHAD